MKKHIKFIFIYTVISILFGACSTSENDNNNKKKVISKITAKYLDYDGSKEVEVVETNTFIYLNGEVIKIEISDDLCGIFNYNGSKISSTSGCKNTSEMNIFSYEGDLLLKTNSNEVVNEFFYDSNKLKEIKASYVTDNFTKTYSSKYYFSGNNVTLTNEEVFWKSEPKITKYKYDNKNNPFKNHNFYFKLSWGADFLGDNNAIEEIIDDTVIKYSIIYDSDDFPLKVTGINQKTGKLWTEYTYEYIEM